MLRIRQTDVDVARTHTFTRRVYVPLYNKLIRGVHWTGEVPVKKNTHSLRTTSRIQQLGPHTKQIYLVSLVGYVFRLSYGPSIDLDINTDNRNL
jgi:hypothetical protein